MVTISKKFPDTVIEKNPHINWLMQFKPMLFKVQLYTQNGASLFFNLSLLMFRMLNNIYLLKNIKVTQKCLK